MWLLWQIVTTHTPPVPVPIAHVYVSHVECPKKISERSGASLTRAEHLPCVASCTRKGVDSAMWSKNASCSG